MGLFSWLFGENEAKVKPEKEKIENVKQEIPKGRQVTFLDFSEDQRIQFLSDVVDLNNLVVEANRIIKDDYPLLDVDNKAKIRLLEEPKTPTGKEPKCPYTLTFDVYDNPGAIYYYKNMSVAGARFTVWKRRQGITIDTGPKNGKMEVERITLNTLPEGYKKRIYTKSK